MDHEEFTSQNLPTSSHLEDADDDEEEQQQQPQQQHPSSYCNNSNSNINNSNSNSNINSNNNSNNSNNNHHNATANIANNTANNNDSNNGSSSSSSSSNNQLANCDESSDQEESCSKGLASQHWYWGDMSKDLIASAMNGRENGTFCVRDASTKGDYTLTLRFGERNKLIKIIVSGSRCGFATEDLKFSSVVQLIDYYRRNSLKEYNRQLEVELLYPLRRPNIDKTIWEVDGVHSVEHLLCQLRGLHAAYFRIQRYYDQILTELETLRDELQRKRQARCAFTSAHALFTKQIQLLQKNKELIRNESELEHLGVNIELQQRRLESIRLQQEQMNEQIAAIEVRIKETEKSRSEITPKLLKLYSELNRCKFRLCQLNVSQSTVDKELQEVSFLTDAEPEPLSRILMQLHVRWQPDRFLSVDCTKENGMKIVRALMDCNPNNSDGIFVIRPSRSQAGHYALTISNDNRIYNCLIEHRDVKHPESCGYAFLNTKLFFPTLVDFVRYYSHCSMKEHNSQLDTRLKIPAFKGTL